MLKLFLFVGIAGVSLATYLATFGQGPDYQMPPTASLLKAFEAEGIVPAANSIVENEEVEHGVFEVPPEDEIELKKAMSMGGMKMDGMKMDGMNMDSDAAKKMPMAEDSKMAMNMDSKTAEKMPMNADGKMPMNMESDAAKKMPMAEDGKMAMNMDSKTAEKMPMNADGKMPMNMEGDAAKKMPMAEDGKMAMNMDSKTAEKMPMNADGKMPMNMESDAAKKMPMAEDGKMAMNMDSKTAEKMPMNADGKMPMNMESDAAKKMPMAEDGKMAMNMESEKAEGGLKITEDGAYDREIKLTMAEWKFSNMQLDVKSGEKIRFTITNGGKIPHEFMFMTMPAMAAVNYRAKRADWNLLEHEALFEKSLVLPGGQFSFVAEIQENGVWMFMCMLPYHMQMGMMGQMATPGMAMEMQM